MSHYDIIVVGAGAAGLMAAGRGATLGARVLLLEKMDKPGRKLLITGKFRCNLTNQAPIRDFISHFGVNGRFLYQSFHHFFSNDLIDFFHNLGVPTVTERGGRVFPASGRSLDVVEALVDWCRRGGVDIKTYTPVNHLLLEEKRVQGVKTADNSHLAKSVIIATGGASYPGTGSTGDGFQLAMSAGHTVIPIRPALVPLNTTGDTAQALQGLSLKNVEATVIVDGKRISGEFGEMLFTHFGVSGPIILTLSKLAVDALADGKKVCISIDLKPALSEERLDARLLRDFDTRGKLQYKTFLKDLLPRKLIPVCITQTGIPENKPCNQITTSQRRYLLEWLKGFRLEINGHRGFRQAIITAGGVDTRQIDPRTMESRIVQGLYFTGEVLDIDADTGGYNLQAAFSTGWIAGTAAAENL